jgi:glycine cleavage system aminomethyltransferase T
MSGASPARSWRANPGAVSRFSTGTRHGFRANGRISPYFEGVEAAGGHAYTKEFNTYVAWSVDLSPAEQYRALTERVTLWDTSSLRLVQAAGPDARRLADRVLTRDMRAVTPGRCVYAFACNPRGIIICDPVVLVIDEETIWFSVAGTDLGLWLQGIAIGGGFDVEISEVSSAPLQVQGPLSQKVMEKICEPGVGELRFFRHIRTSVAGADAVVSRTGWTGELGYEIYPMNSAFYPGGREVGMRLWRAILEAGGEFGIAVTPYVVDRALEGGIMVFNNPAREQISALEFHSPGPIDLDGGDFVGKSAMMRVLDQGGPARRLMALLAVGEGETIAKGEWALPVYKDREVAGRSQRQGFSYGRRRGIAAALLSVASVATGDHVVIHHPGGRTLCTVAGFPVIPARSR